MKEIRNFVKRYWWIIAIIIFIIGLPILLNFWVFKPVSKLSVGTLQDWMSFWGSYLGATISALVAFVILGIQRKDTKHNYEQIRRDNQMQFYRNKRIMGLEEAIRKDKENTFNHQFQTNQILYQQEIRWLSDLRKTLANYISAYGENEVKDIIYSIQSSSFESIQQKIKETCNALAHADTAFSLVVSENSKTTIGDTYQKELAKMYARYMSIINDIQLLACIYYDKAPISNEASDSLNNLIAEMGIDSKNMDYNQFSELAHQIIKPLSGIIESVKTLSQSCIKEERQRVESLLLN